nr:MAG: zinc ABC transporter ATP-binding protein [Bacillota bacterium]
MREPVVELEHVWFSYGGEPVLQDISLTVGRGDFVGIVGPNGSGKTTLLRLILGLQPPQQGRIRLFGQDLSSFRRWDRVGYVPQKATSFNSDFPATVREVVLTGRIAPRGLFRPLGRKDRELADRALALVGLEAYADRPIGRLSGGQQQRVFIARALAGQPELLILDEPTVGVDAAAQQQFYALLRRLREELGITILLVSHDIGAVTTEVSHLACLNRRLFFHGPPEQFPTEDLSDFYGHPVTPVAHGH